MRFACLSIALALAACGSDRPTAEQLDGMVIETHGCLAGEHRWSIERTGVVIHHPGEGPPVRATLSGDAVGRLFARAAALRTAVSSPAAAASVVCAPPRAALELRSGERRWLRECSGAWPDDWSAFVQGVEALRDRLAWEPAGVRR